MTLHSAPSAQPQHQGARRGSHLFAAAAVLVVVTVAWLVAYTRRLQLGFANVDDNLYALQTLRYLRALEADGLAGLAESWQQFGNNSPFVPTLAMLPASFSAEPLHLVVVQLPLLLLLVVAVAGLGRQLGLGATTSWLVAGAVTTTAPVLEYAVMLHFGLASTLGVVAALAAYLASDRLRGRWWSALFGLALGVVAVARVIGPLYVVVVLLVVGLHFVAEREQLRRRLGSLLLAAGSALLVAAPWWLVSGRAALTYLSGQGLDDSSVFVTEASVLERIYLRFRQTAGEQGMILWWLGVAAAAWLLWRLWRQWRRPHPSVAWQDADTVIGPRPIGLRPGSVLVVVATAFGGVLALSVSTNLGTAFALPLQTLFLILLGAAVTTLWVRGRAARAVALVAAGLVLVTTALQFVPASSSVAASLWQVGAPADRQLRTALGCYCSLPSDLDERVVAVIGEDATLLVRDDAALNAQSLLYAAEMQGLTLALNGGEAEEATAGQTAYAHVVTGSTRASYRTGDELSSDPDDEAVLIAAGYRIVLDEQLSPQNRVTVWSLEAP